MPLKHYFKGSGYKVMKSMKDTYKDEEKAESVFHATANKRGMAPKSKSRPRAKSPRKSGSSKSAY